MCIRDRIYLDNSATTQKPQAVIASIANFYENYNSNVHRGIHKLAERSTLEFENARQSIAEFIGVNADEIIFTSGSTESLNIVSQMLFEYFHETKEKKTILLSEMEHHSNILPWMLLAGKLGCLLYTSISGEWPIKDSKVNCT